MSEIMNHYMNKYNKFREGTSRRSFQLKEVGSNLPKKEFHFKYQHVVSGHHIGQ